MAESTNWEERLDVDDSDLLAAVPPVSSSSWQLRPCSSSRALSTTNPNPNPRSVSVSVSVSVSPRVIPGPAGAVQAAMHRSQRREVDENGSELVGGSMDLDLDGEREVDGDFQLDSWIYAMHYLGREGDSVSPIGSIRTRTTGRIPMVVGLVKSCTPNGHGDLNLTLKDKTGSISASIHHKALLEGNLGSDIAVGCVLILKQVVVFSPARSIRYLNITEDNVVKLIGKNFGPPQEILTFSVATPFQVNGKREEKKQMEQPVVNSGIETRSDRGDSCGIISRLNPKANEVPRITNNIQIQRSTRVAEPAQGSQDMVQNALCNKISKEDIYVEVLKDSLNPLLENSEKENSVTKITIPEWTDEQLAELFADY